MDEGPRTFRDHVLSIYQSAVEDLARRTNAEAAARGLESIDRNEGSVLIEAAEAVAAVRDGRKTDSHPVSGGAGLEAISPIDLAKVCASLGLQYMEAKLIGDSATADRLKSELRDSPCDPRWAQTIEAYLKYFGPSGTRLPIPYVQADKVGARVIIIKPNAKIVLVGDWGTGVGPAIRILQQLNALNPDIIVHLGDIYYSGTETECVGNFEKIIDGVIDRSRVPIYTLAGNHDMYSGGAGYYALIKRLNKAPLIQPASFFCLRAENNEWQFLAMDTGLHDYSPFSVTDALTFLEQDEQAWHKQRIVEFPGKTILLSHHQLFSAFSQIGKPGPGGALLPYNPRLLKTFDDFRSTGKRISAWFWGHEHNLCIYKPYLNLERGRCIGHGAIPVFTEDDPYETLEKAISPPQLVDGTKLSTAGNIYTHGFATVTLGPASGVATAEYFEDAGGTTKKTYTETIA